MGATMAPQPSPPASRPRGRDLRAPQKTATAPPEPMESPRALPLLELLSWGKHQCEPTIALGICQWVRKADPSMPCVWLEPERERVRDKNTSFHWGIWGVLIAESTGPGHRRPSINSGE